MSSTVGRERRVNTALREVDEDAFVAELTAGLGAYPRYYAYMGPANRGGPDAADLSPPRPVSPAEIRRRIDAGEWVVDLRSRQAFARVHVRGSISVELNDSFATYLGWAQPWGQPLTLIGDGPEDVAEAQRQLGRIGVDGLAAATGPTRTWPGAGWPATRWPTSRAWPEPGARPGSCCSTCAALDEWQEGHLAGAVHIPFWELEDRIGDVPAGEVWVYCHSGLRASIGASILDRAGRSVVHIDDNWTRAAEIGLPLDPAAQA